MARIAFILLCHKDPNAIIAQVRSLTAAGDCVAVHFDRRSSAADFAALRQALSPDPNVAFAPRVRCGWGEWSLVEATLNGLRTALDAFPGASHVYLISGDCVPIKSARYCHAVLDDDPADRIETVDFFGSGWIRTGMVEDRLIYRHVFNERTQKRLFYGSLELQRRLGMTRSLPEGVGMRIGSQWWCLRRSTATRILEFIARRPDIRRFFRHSWIPDETFFQTLVHHLVPRDEIRQGSPTFLMFSDYGMPVTFYNDHYAMLLRQTGFFARKISPDAADLKTRLTALYASGQAAFDVTDEGRRVYRFLAEAGRQGRRHAPRIWDRDTTLAPDRRLLVVICKKWHVARRFVDRVSFVSNLPAVDYVFDEEDPALPDLGGIERGRQKRSRSARAVMSLLFDHFGTDRLLVCLDPARIEIARALSGFGTGTRVLEIDCRMSDEYLAGHALRIGLAAPSMPKDTVLRLLPTLRMDVEAELRELRAAGLPRYHQMRETAVATENAVAIAGFLDIAGDKAAEIAAEPALFDD